MELNLYIVAVHLNYWKMISGEIEHFQQITYFIGKSFQLPTFVCVDFCRIIVTTPTSTQLNWVGFNLIMTLNTTPPPNPTHPTPPKLNFLHKEPQINLWCCLNNNIKIRDNNNNKNNINNDNTTTNNNNNRTKQAQNNWLWPHRN